VPLRKNFVRAQHYRGVNSDVCNVLVVCMRCVCVCGGKSVELYVVTHPPIFLYTLLTTHQVWSFLYKIYGGGPVLPRASINLYAPPIDVPPAAPEALDTEQDKGPMAM